MGYSGAGGNLIHEKNQKQKSRDTVPLMCNYELKFWNLSGNAFKSGDPFQIH